MIRECLDEFIGACLSAGFFAFFLGCIRITPAEIVKNRAGEEDVLLQYNGYLTSECIKVILADVLAADIDGATFHIVETADQIDERRLRTSGSADNTDRLTGADGKVDIVKYRYFGIFGVAECHMIETDASVCDIKAWILWVVQSTFLIDDFCDTSCTGNTHGDHNEYHREHHQTHKNVHTVGKQCKKITGLKGGADHHMSTEPADQKNTAVYGKLHERRVPYDNRLGFKQHIVDVLAGLFKSAFFVIASYISFYNADRRYVFLNTFI